MKNIATASLTYREMERAIVEIEAILNSNVLAALTPGHFLVGEPLTAPVDPDASE